MTQKEKIGQTLKKIKPNVTALDRKEAVKQFNNRYETVTRYLNGQVKDIDTAEYLLTFFTSRINKREKLIIQ